LRKRKQKLGFRKIDEAGDHSHHLTTADGNAWHHEQRDKASRERDWVLSRRPHEPRGVRVSQRKVLRDPPLGQDSQNRGESTARRWMDGDEAMADLEHSPVIRQKRDFGERDQSSHAGDLPKRRDSIHQPASTLSQS
jgi:hypothetical protein